jgi:hypothetical protein
MLVCFSMYSIILLLLCYLGLANAAGMNSVAGDLLGSQGKPLTFLPPWLKLQTSQKRQNIN